MHRRTSHPRTGRLARASGGLAGIALALVMVVAPGTGCASGPSMSGIGFAGTRVVGVNDIVELRIPLREDGSREWRISSFDSIFLTLLEEPRPVQSSSGEFELLMRARAVRAGETMVELTEVQTRSESASRGPKVKRFTIRIVG